MKKVLIIQTAFIGDVILATPVASELKRIYPTIEIDFLVKKGNESLLSNHPCIKNVFVFDKTKGKLKNMLSLIRQFRKSDYDLCINLHRFSSSGIIAGFSKAKKIYGYKKNPFSFLYTKKFIHEIGNSKHEVERNLQIIKEFNANSLVRPSLYPTQEQINKIADLHYENYYCFAPASVWFTKQLPVEKWVQLIQHYNVKGTIILLGGKSDESFCDEIIEKAQVKAHNLAGKLNLLESAELMKHANMNFVNDSGPLHFASAVNAPVTAFFCSTIPAFGFGPLSDHSKIIEVKEKLNCRPCGLHGYKTCPEKHFDCGNKINLNELI